MVPQARNPVSEINSTFDWPLLKIYRTTCAGTYLFYTDALPFSSETDKVALLALKEKLTNGVPDSLPSWNESLHFCQWQGVRCSPHHMRVSILELENENWGGSLGPSLGNLTFLKKLNLTNMNLHGEIPREVGRLRRLQILDLRKNNLHGEIPMEIRNCPSLEVIILLYNNLTGNVPSWFGSMMQLTHLLLGANNLVGSIPPSLGNLSSLERLSLSRNHLNGNIPYSFGKLSNLKELNLGLNSFSGIVPQSLYNLSNLEVLVLGVNQLEGTLPLNIDLSFPNLQVLMFGGNKLTGIFPPSIFNLSELQAFDISANSFSGPIPTTLGSLTKLLIFDVGINSLGSGRVNDLEFISSLTNCTKLQQLILDENNFGGALPDSIGNLSTQLQVLDVSFNQIYGRIPEGIGNLIGLGSLIMQRNSLRGTIPNSIGNLKNLVRLVLQENKLGGNIPTVIGNLTMLSEVHLSTNKLEGNIPFTLRNCTNMQSFSVSDNNLSGNIPNQTFSYQQGLVTLDLSTNSFIGPFPSELGNLKHLSILYIHFNKLSGEIPMELGACSALTELVLERNFFHGSIPSFLGSLRSLKILVLSKNNLSGTIPHELENLTSLNFLDLSYNNLHGEVPTRVFFSNISKISLIGNKDLCGGIPQLNLSSCSRLPSQKHKRPLKKKCILIIVMIGGVLISLMTSISYYYNLRKKYKKLSSLLPLKYINLRVSYEELHQATNGFSSSNLIGGGGFSSVYKGTLVHFARPIAVKVLNLQTRWASKSFVAECETLGRIKHRNLIKLFTCCSSVDYQGEDFKAIVLEFMPNGSLDSMLHNNEHNGSRNLNLNLQQRVDIALDVAHALDYLHNGLEEAIIHCDIKPSNVLLDDDMVAHLGDFGLARLLNKGTSNSNGEQASTFAVKGTIGYVPPEYGEGSRISPEGDIYSYGILILEMLTGKKPTDCMIVEDISLRELCNKATPECITEIVDSRLVFPPDARQNSEDIIRECLVQITRIGVECCSKFPAKRMRIKDVIMLLQVIKHKLACLESFCDKKE